jgi:hypothetical protein
MGVGLATIARVTRDPDFRRGTFEAVAQRFPLDSLLEEIAVEVDAARAALADQAESEPAEQNVAAAKGAATASRPRRSKSRTRGDTNGQSGRKPPNRGTRAA